MESLPLYFTQAHREINLSLLQGEEPEIVPNLVEELQTLPSPDPDSLRRQYPDYDGEHLWRGLTLPPEDLELFFEQHKEGEVVTYPAFTSTTVLPPSRCKYGYGDRPIQLKIRHLTPTGGKHVDPFKKKKDEGELLFPPRSSFLVRSKRVTSVVPRTPHSLRKIFASSSEGFGIPNLTLGELLGEGRRTLEDLRNSPDYSWFRSLLKKNSPPSATWHVATTVGELYSPPKLKGGKAAFYYAAASSLPNPEGEVEPRNVEIYLEEVR